MGVCGQLYTPTTLSLGKEPLGTHKKGDGEPQSQSGHSSKENFPYPCWESNLICPAMDNSDNFSTWHDVNVRNREKVCISVYICEKLDHGGTTQYTKKNWLHIFQALWSSKCVLGLKLHNYKPGFHCIFFSFREITTIRSTKMQYYT